MVEKADSPDPRNRPGERSGGAEWARLRLLLATRPPLGVVESPVGAVRLRAAGEQIALTAAAANAFADTLQTAFPRQPAPPTRDPGGAPAVAELLTQWCRQLARNWTDPRDITPAQVAEFNHEVTVLAAMLDEYATEPLDEQGADRGEANEPRLI